MRSFYSKILHLFKIFGFSPRDFLSSTKGFPAFVQNRSKIKKQLSSGNSDFTISSYYPFPGDRFQQAGSIPLHYFYQDLYVAQQLIKNNPIKHVDIGSRIDGFVAHVAAVRSIEVMDIRKITDEIPNVRFIQADLMSTDFNFTNYCDSVSCLHAIEHFGLGRYGDTVDINGHLKGIRNITMMLRQGGRFYFSTVIGPQRIEFDAHRVFSVKYLIDLIGNNFGIENFSYIDDNNNLHISAELNDENIQNNFNCLFGCGIFELVKK